MHFLALRYVRVLFAIKRLLLPIFFLCLQRLGETVSKQTTRFWALSGKFMPMVGLFFMLAFVNTILDSLKDTLVITSIGGGAQVGLSSGARPTGLRNFYYNRQGEELSLKAKQTYGIPIAYLQGHPVF